MVKGPVVSQNSRSLPASTTGTLVIFNFISATTGRLQGALGNAVSLRNTKPAAIALFPGV